MNEQPRAAAEAETQERRRHGSSFGAAAAAYAEHRPGYAETAVRWALEPAWSGRPLRVIDLGAGTGKLTATLVQLGADVTAVEPDPNMLAELRRELPSVRSVSGSAEAIPRPDASADAVLVGQALHWFEMDRAMPEIARVLVPGGVFASLWNVDDDRVGWVAGFSAMTKREATITVVRWQDGAARERQQDVLAAGSGLLGAAQTAEFGYGLPRTVESLLAMIATHSNFLILDEAERNALLARVREFLLARPETSGGEFVLPMATVVLRALRQ